MSYISVSNMYNIGFIKHNESSIRIKQNLEPQESANQCKLNTGQCQNMYPFPATQINYGAGKISNECSCARWVQPP